jgi:hypothetical protein
MKSSDYFGLALQCAREASEASDPDRKKTLLAISALYNKTALDMEAGMLQEKPSLTIASKTGVLP